MKHQLDKLVKGIEKLKQFQNGLDTLNKRTYYSVLASLESLEPELVQSEMPTGDIVEKVVKLNSMLSERAATVLLSTVDYAVPLIDEYLKEVPENFNPEAFQTAKDKISQTFKTTPIKPFHSLSDMQRENLLNVVKKHFDLSEPPSIDLVNILVDGYNAGAPKLNIARQANIDFVIKQDYEIKEDDQRILDLELVTFLKHRVRELFVAMDKIKFDRSMGTGSFGRVIRDFSESGNDELLGRLKEIVATASIIEVGSFESHETNLDKINVLPISPEIIACAKEIYSPGLRDIVTKFATTGQGEPFSEIMEKYNPSIYQNQLLSEYVVFLGEVKILTASVGLLAKVLKANANILSVATATINELDAKFDAMYKEIIEVTETEDTVSVEGFEWIKKLFGVKAKAFNIKVPTKLKELIALEQETLAKIQYHKSQGINKFAKNKDRFLATIDSELESITGVKTNLKHLSPEELESWISNDLPNIKNKYIYYESLFKVNKEYTLKLGNNFKEMASLVESISKDISWFMAGEEHDINDLDAVPSRLDELVVCLNIFNRRLRSHDLSAYYDRYFGDNGNEVSFTVSDAKELSKSNVDYLHNADLLYGLYHEFKDNIYGPINEIRDDYDLSDDDIVDEIYSVADDINECLYTVSQMTLDVFPIEYTYGSYVFILVSYLEALKG